jgi:hypothetical protein
MGPHDIHSKWALTFLGSHINGIHNGSYAVESMGVSHEVELCVTHLRLRSALILVQVLK